MIYTDGASVARWIDTVFWIPSSSFPTVIGNDSNTLNGPVLTQNKLQSDFAARRSAPDIVSLWWEVEIIVLSDLNRFWCIANFSIMLVLMSLLQ